MNEGPPIVDDFTETHTGRTHRFTGTATETMVEMALQVIAERETTLSQSLDQGNTASGRFPFIMEYVVGGAMRQAHTTHHAAVRCVEQVSVSSVGLQELPVKSGIQSVDDTPV